MRIIHIIRDLVVVALGFVAMMILILSGWTGLDND
jgi:hypothetical protein